MAKSGRRAGHSKPRKSSPSMGNIRPRVFPNRVNIRLRIKDLADELGYLNNILEIRSKVTVPEGNGLFDKFNFERLKSFFPSRKKRKLKELRQKINEKSMELEKLKVQDKKVRGLLGKKVKLLEEYELDRKNAGGRVRIKKTEFKSQALKGIPKYEVSLRVLDDAETLKRAESYFAERVRNGENPSLKPEEIRTIIEAREAEREIQKAQKAIEEIASGKHDKQLKKVKGTGKQNLEKRRIILLNQNLVYRDKQIERISKLMAEKDLTTAIDKYNKGRLLFERGA